MSDLFDGVSFPDEPAHTSFLDRITARDYQLTTAHDRKQARAELAQLREDSLALIGSNYLLAEIGKALGCAPDATILQHIDEQARQLSEAREYLTEWRETPFFESHDEWEKWARNLAARVDAWLAANAPQPTAEQFTTHTGYFVCKSCGSTDVVAVEDELLPTPEQFEANAPVDRREAR